MIFIKNKVVVNIDELKHFLNTTANMTVHRHLLKANYISSISHRGKYYTLSDIPDFDENNIWRHSDIIFSKNNTLINTIKYIIDNSKTGYTANDLQELLTMDVKGALLTLLKRNEIQREKLPNIYIYFSKDKKTYKNQKIIYNKKLNEYSINLSNINNDLLANEIKAAIIIFFSLLNEKQRRLYAGLESIKIGHGGDKVISELLGVNEHTIAKGRKELIEPDIDKNRVRKPGGGRYSQEKKLLK